MIKGKSFKIQYGQIYSRLNKLNKQIAEIFKIQYGQIYSEVQNGDGYYNEEFKIQYGQIYRLDCDIWQNSSMGI